ncbi:MAG: hypothetical protein AAF533_14985 [Acidobacteriota bacterium]
MEWLPIVIVMAAAIWFAWAVVRAAWKPKLGVDPDDTGDEKAALELEKLKLELGVLRTPPLLRLGVVIPILLTVLAFALALNEAIEEGKLRSAEADDRKEEADVVTEERNQLEEEYDQLVDQVADRDLDLAVSLGIVSDAASVEGKRKITLRFRGSLKRELIEQLEVILREDFNVPRAHRDGNVEKSLVAYVSAEDRQIAARVGTAAQEFFELAGCGIEEVPVVKEPAGRLASGDVELRLFTTCHECESEAVPTRTTERDFSGEQLDEARRKCRAATLPRVLPSNSRDYGDWVNWELQGGSIGGVDVWCRCRRVLRASVETATPGVSPPAD